MRGLAIKTQPFFHPVREASPASAAVGVAAAGAAGLNPVSTSGERTPHGNGTISNELPVVYLARHGETAWSLTGQHTGLTDLPLTERGEENALALGKRLTGLNFGKVFTSPLQRATRTCELAEFGAVAEVDRNLVEWDYGQYEGLTSAQIRAGRPDWQLFRDGCPGGESPEQVAARADAMVDRVRHLGTNALLFS